MRLGINSAIKPTTWWDRFRKITSIGNFMPMVWIPRLGISHKASSGPRLVRFNKPIRRVRKLSALRTLVASHVSFVKLITGTKNPPLQRIREHFDDSQPWRSEQNDEDGRENEKHQWKNQFDDGLARGFFRRLAALVAHGFRVDAKRARDAAAHFFGLREKGHERAKLVEPDPLREPQQRILAHRACLHFLRRQHELFAERQALRILFFADPVERRVHAHARFDADDDQIQGVWQGLAHLAHARPGFTQHRNEGKHVADRCAGGAEQQKVAHGGAGAERYKHAAESERDGQENSQAPENTHGAIAAVAGLMQPPGDEIEAVGKLAIAEKEIRDPLPERGFFRLVEPILLATFALRADALQTPLNGVLLNRRARGQDKIDDGRDQAKKSDGDEQYHRKSLDMNLDDLPEHQNAADFQHQSRRQHGPAHGIGHKLVHHFGLAQKHEKGQK